MGMEDALRLVYDGVEHIESWGVLTGMTLLFSAVTWFLLRQDADALL